MNDPDIQRILAEAKDPLVVDLGYGARPTTTFELAARLRSAVPATRVVGLEIDPSRVVPARDGVEFRQGGFELAGLNPVLVRAFNVLRQYSEEDVGHAWATMRARLAPHGRIIDGTCDELGRRCAWITLDETGPLTLTLAWDPHAVALPSDIAERLPKALIHRNIAGERIHDVLRLADSCWVRSAAYASYGPRQRWRATLCAMREAGLAVTIPRRRLRDCVLTLSWETVAPK
ncbi:class I SAM-dependent methyltransferase [Hoyosella sp. YIM 151337]|uniref:class I SAM-dependent methyltransferase n=1 Tax=Hoyosella sp. YIM 151337 TaxID=2992742 RepID=UPI0035A92C83